MYRNLVYLNRSFLPGTVLVMMAAGLQGAVAQPVDLLADSPVSYTAAQSSTGEDPHVSGQFLEFCKQGGTWLGYAGEFLGPPADPAVAALERVEIDEPAGLITFSFQLAAGATLLPGSAEWIPATKQYEFSGRIGDERIVGTMRVTPLYGSTDRRVPTQAAVSFERQQTDDQSCVRWREIWLRRIEARQAVPGTVE